MNTLKSLFSTVLILLCLGFAGTAFAEDTHPPGLTINPNPAPANQESAAVFHYVTNPASMGFWDTEHPPTVINGNVITFGFDTGCGFLCPPAEPTYTAFPFTMPALPAGTYVVRFAVDPYTPSAVLAEFTVNIGLGGVTSTVLPVGGSASVLLGLLMLMLGWTRLRTRGDTRKIGA